MLSCGSLPGRIFTLVRELDVRSDGGGKYPSFVLLFLDELRSVPANEDARSVEPETRNWEKLLRNSDDMDERCRGDETSEVVEAVLSTVGACDVTTQNA
jgi:hypothetical protein